jgi:trehalose-phosphatase
MTISYSTPVPPVQVPHLSSTKEDISRLIRQKKIFIFLDYDGTLTPIVPVPSEAYLDVRMKELLYRLIDKVNVSIVTGRGRVPISEFLSNDVVEKISLAASHGFDIRLRTGERLQIGDSSQISNFNRFKQELKNSLHLFPPGVSIEETTFSTSVHYRNVETQDCAAVESALDHLINKYEGLKKTEGKKVFETRLNIDWNKGKAIEYILSKTTSHIPLDDMLVIYIGDDITDEDGFQSVNKYPNHLSIIVSADEDIGRPTFAEYRLADPDEVKIFLTQISVIL